MFEIATRGGCEISFSIQHYVHLRRIYARIVYRFFGFFATHYMLVLTPQDRVCPEALKDRART